MSEPSPNSFLYGVNCAWIGSPAEAANDGAKCPFCGGMLGAWSSEEAFWRIVDGLEAGDYETPPEQPNRAHPGYRKMWEWAREEMNRRKQCYKNVPHMRNSYAKHTGNQVDITP